MTTSDSPSPSSPAQERESLRLTIAEHPARGKLGGAWWPQSRDIDLEFAALVEEFPALQGRVMRGLFSRPDWDTAPRKVATHRGFVKVGSFPNDDTHLMILTVSAEPWRLQLLVVPSDATADKARALMAAAASVDVAGAKALLVEHGVL
ncbi:MAG TPA: DUF5994 family protein [Nocardioidaceae bacterium]|nr:DUF5994 family protein [Nocardioidaceae bacterium]